MKILFDREKGEIIDTRCEQNPLFSGKISICYTLMCDDITKGPKPSATPYIDRCDELRFENGALFGDATRSRVVINELLDGVCLELDCKGEGISELGDASESVLNTASGFIGGYTFTDKVNSLINAVYQSPTGQGENTKGVAADLSSYAGQTVNVTFAAVPKADTSTLCLIAYVKGVEVLLPNGTYIDPNSDYKESAVAYASSLDMINGKGEGDAASFSRRGGNSTKGIDVFAYNNTTINGSNLIFSGWTVADGGIEKYVWSVDGKTWYDVTLVGRQLGDANETFINDAAGYIGNYTFTDTENTPKNANYQSPTGLGAETKGVAADLSDFVGETVNVTFAAVPKADTTSLCLIAYVTGVEVLSGSTAE